MLEPGKLAELSVLDPNRLVDIHHANTIRYMMKNGRLYEGEALEEAYPRAAQVPRQCRWGHNLVDIGATQPCGDEVPVEGPP